MNARTWLLAGWIAALAGAIGVRLWNALSGPLLWGYDAWGHLAYVLFLDLYGALPWADQGWSYYQPPLHYVLGAALAQLGSAEALVRGLSLLGSAFSLAMAALAAQVVRAVSPERPGLALLGFVAAAFLPVHLYVSPMPGNEMTVAFLGTAAIAAYLANERRASPSRKGDALTGALLGAALLTKFTGLVPLLAIGAAFALRALVAARRRAPLAPWVVRGTLVIGLAVAIAGPLYARNVHHFGDPFPSNSDFPLVRDVESAQAPGVRHWSDYLRVSPRTLAHPDPKAPHLLHAVWSTFYLNAWADTQRESEVDWGPAARRAELRTTSTLGWLGLAPTALALVGALLAAWDVGRGRRRGVYVPLLLLSAAMLAAFVRFTWGVPTWAALKASYALILTIPYAVFVARAAEPLLQKSLWPLPAVAVVVPALAAAVVGSEGVVLPQRHDAPAAGAARFYFGEYDAAREVYGRLMAGAPYPVPWLDNLAAVEIADGRPERARDYYARAVTLAGQAGRPDPLREGRLAVAAALLGDLAAARQQLESVLAWAPVPELRANLGAVRAAGGDLAGAELDLRAALAQSAELVPAWWNLAQVLEQLGRGEAAREARRAAVRHACAVPRGYPQGIGTGEILEWGVGRRWLLLLAAPDDPEPILRAALPAWFRGACRAARRHHG